MHAIAIIAAQIDFEQVEREAIRRAEAAGYFPAQFQRPVDWAQVVAWAEYVRHPEFAWRTGGPYDRDAIVVGPGPDGRLAIHAGQHRLLGGLLGDRPVPREAICFLTVEDRTRGWREDAPDLDTALKDVFAGAIGRG